MPRRQVKYNPAFLTEDELVENFVVRHTDLKLIIQTIKENDTRSNQHLLVIGPRGSGKTTLIRRAAAEVKRDKALQERWYPLIFAEESYEVVSAGEFWLESLFHLSEQTGDSKWKQTYLELREETDDQRLRERCLGQLLDFADSRSQRILIMVENINMLFGDLESDDDGWTLRHTLINEPRIMLLATATIRFEQIEHSSKPMFEMFKIQELKPLDDSGCNRVWGYIAGKPLADERIKPIRILTGGSPRLLTIIAQFGARRSFRQLLDDIVDLIDDHTEYFKSHLDHLPPKERKVYLALAELWDPSTAKKIATAARMDVNKASANLKRLVDKGAVSVEDQRKNIKWYAVAERMYNIYYLMRRRGGHSSRVRATVRFMLSLYDPKTVATLIADEACGIPLERCDNHYLAFLETLKIVDSKELQQVIISVTPHQFRESPSIKKSIDGFVTEQKEMLSETLQGRLSIKTIEALIQKSVRAMERGDNESCVKNIKHVLNQLYVMSGDGKTEELNKILSLLDELVARFGASKEVALQEQVAMAMVNKGVTLSQLKRSDDAIAVYDELVVRFGASKEVALQEQVAKAMFNKGVTLSQLKRSDDAIAVYDELVVRFGASKEVALQELVAKAMTSKGLILFKSNEFEIAKRAFHKALEICPEFVSPALRLFELLLKTTDNSAPALKFIEEKINARSTDINLLNGAAWALYVHDNLALLLKAEKWAQKAVSLDPNRVHCHTLACILSALGKGDEALKAAGSFIEDTDFVADSIEDAIELIVALAASGKAKEALDLLIATPAAEHLEPLIVGIKLYLGENVKVAYEIEQMAKDVVQRINERAKHWKR